MGATKKIIVVAGLAVSVSLVCTAAIVHWPKPISNAGNRTDATPTSSFIPSLYAYNHGERNDAGSNNQYRRLLQEFCDGRTHAQAIPGLETDGEFAVTMYNLPYWRYREDTEYYNRQIDWLIGCARKTGRLRVLINYNFYRSPKQKLLICETSALAPSHEGGCNNMPDGSPGYIPANVADAMTAFELLLGEHGPEKLAYTFRETELRVLAGITLAEENVTWDYALRRGDGGAKYLFQENMRSDFLNDLYLKLKETFGADGYQFLQWYSPHATKLNYPGSGETWPLIGADGWVFNQYTMSILGRDNSFVDSNYHQYAQAITNLGKPVFSIVWASPLRYPRASGKGKLNFDWWSRNEYGNQAGGWKGFHGQVAVNQSLGITTLFYALTPHPLGTVDYDVFMTQADIPKECGMEMFTELIHITLPFFRGNRIPATYAPAKPDWILSAPTECSNIK